jgi:uncharacterized protein YceH (UPF0502 family)
MTDETASQVQSQAPRWQPLSAVDRRVAGALVEKAKTTPSAYPMSLNGVVTACNQKSNRDPVMELQPDDVQESLDRLRHLGAVGMVEGIGRVTKYRHYLYDWLGVEKVEMAVMVELLLRGPQTEGELRGRASRMEPIADLAALRPILDCLKAKGLILPLTPEGRGHVVTHVLYPEAELQRLKARYSAARPVSDANHGEVLGGVSTVHSGSMVDLFREELRELRSDLAELRTELAALTAALEQTDSEVRRLREDLGA